MTLTPLKSYAIIFLAYVAGLWAMSIPLTGDQKVYLSVALEMRERGEWIIPYLFDEANFLKPPFQYWATLLGWKVFGLSLFGALIPSVLALVGSAYLINALFNSKSGLAGLLFASCLGTMTYGTTAQMEIWIVLFYLWAWLEWKRDRPYTALALVGVMAWIKGPLYPVLWVLSAAGEKIATRQKLRFKHLFALVLGAGIGLSWYALAANSQWDAMMDVFFRRENLGKIQTSQGTPWGLWGEFLYSLFPWLPVFILACFSAKARQQWLEKKNFLLAFTLLPALFFTFFPYRVNTYLYLLAPVFAWMASTLPSGALTRRERRVHLVLTGNIVVLAVALAITSFRLAQGGWIGWEITVLIILNLFLWNFLFIKRAWTGFAWVCLMMVSLIRVGAIQIGERDLAGLRHYQKEHPSSSFAYWLQEMDIWHEFGLVSAAIRQNIARIDEVGIIVHLSQSGVLLLNEEQHPLVAERFGPLECTSWPRLKRRLKFPFQKLLQSGLRADDAEVIRYFFICKARH